MKRKALVFSVITGICFMLSICCRATEVKADSVYIGRVVLVDNTYTTDGKSREEGSLPSEGYAYYKDGVLRLNNFIYSGNGKALNTKTKVAIYADGNLTIELIGLNDITLTKGSATTNFYCLHTSNDLTISGKGRLTLENTGSASGENTALKCDKLEVNGGTVIAKAGKSASYSISSWGVVYESLVMNNGVLIAQGRKSGTKKKSGDSLLTNFLNDRYVVTSSNDYKGANEGIYSAVTVAEHNAYKYIKISVCNDKKPASIKSVYCWHESGKVFSEINFDYISQEGILFLTIYDKEKLIKIIKKPLENNISKTFIEFDADKSYIDYDIKVLYLKDYISLKPLAEVFNTKITQDEKINNTI